MRAPQDARKIKDRAVCGLEGLLWDWFAGDLCDHESPWYCREALLAEEKNPGCIVEYLQQFDVKLVRRKK